MKLGILTGLAREVECLPQNEPNLIITCSGASPDRAEALSRSLVNEGCGALLSFGVAGALSPDLSVGDIIIGLGTIDKNGNRLESAENWKSRVYDGLPKSKGAVKEGWIYGSDLEIDTRQMKAKLFQQTGALCVDMESHRLAQIATANSIPFLAIRVISDDADRALPSSVIGVIGENGKPIISQLIKGLVRTPNQIPQLIALSKNMEIAISELRRVSSLIGPFFRFA